jgi:hypothetical protein
MPNSFKVRAAFMHFRAKDNAVKLAKTLRTAFDKMAVDD